jgi:hypothetical protein
MKLKLILAAILALSIPACTDQEMAKNFGGEAVTTLPKGTKLVNVTWKEDSLWLLTRKMEPGEQPQTYEFAESSSWGLFEGKVVIIESR